MEDIVIAFVIGTCFGYPMGLLEVYSQRLYTGLLVVLCAFVIVAILVGGASVGEGWSAAEMVAQIIGVLVGISGGHASVEEVSGR